MCLDPTALGPAIGVVMMADIGQQKARLGLVDDDANIAAGAHRPKMRVARATALRQPAGVGPRDGA
jgi:hypothetical protein